MKSVGMCYLILLIMISALVANVASNKYIVLSQWICTTQHTDYNYNKIRLKKNFII